MGDVNEMWSSPWRTLQKNLASGIAIAGMESGTSQWIRGPQCSSRVVASSSWLMRARGLNATAPRIIQ
jgi:hypothetical protein